MKHQFNKPLFFFPLLIFLLGTLFPIEARGQKKVRLNLALKPGSSFQMINKVHQDMEIGIMGMNQETSNTLETDFLYEVSEKDAAGNIALIATYENFRVKNKSMQGEFTYDSQDEASSSPNLVDTYGAMLGKQFNVIISPAGEIVRVSGMDRIIDDMLDQQSALDETVREQMKTGLKQQLGDHALKDQLASTFDIYPDKKVRPGDTWNKQWATDYGMGMTMNTTYKLEEVGPVYATVSYRTIITPNPDSKGLDMGMMLINYQVNGSQTGELRIRLTDGLTIFNESLQDIAGKVFMSGEAIGEMEGDLKLTGAYYTAEKE